jgi:hypothetical protein
MFCASCGSQMPDDSSFCGNCGAQIGQAASAATGGGTPARPAAQYIPPRQPFPTPPVKPDRTGLWIALSAAALIIVAAAIAIPLLVRDKGGDGTSSTTGGLTTTVTTAVAGTTATSAATVSTAPPTTAAPTTATTAPPAPADEWVEADIPGGPWKAYDVAVSDEALLLGSSTATGSRLVAVMLGSGDVIELTEADAAFGADIDGHVAVWWEANGWDDAAQAWSEQHIYSFHLPDGPRTEISAGGGVTMSMPQVALPYITWVEGEPWADNPTEFQAERILMGRLDDNGAPTGAMTTVVPLALANTMGDAGWAYSLSSTCLAWQHATAAGGLDPGTHVLEIDTESHGHIGSDAWWPSLWQHTLVYVEGGLKFTDLSAGGIHDFAAAGDFPCAGPTFAAFYRMADSGTEIVVKDYNGTYEQVLGVNPDPPWFCPAIAVSESYIAFIVGTDVHLVKWQ